MFSNKIQGFETIKSEKITKKHDLNLIYEKKFEDENGNKWTEFEESLIFYSMQKYLFKWKEYSCALLERSHYKISKFVNFLIQRIKTSELFHTIFQIYQGKSKIKYFIFYKYITREKNSISISIE